MAHWMVKCHRCTQMRSMGGRYGIGGRIPKVPVVIPRAVCRLLGIRPGQKMQVIAYEGRIELVPVKDVKEARGFLKGIDTSVEREEGRI